MAAVIGDNASEIAFEEAGGWLDQLMATSGSGQAHGVLDGLWVCWDWKRFDLGENMGGACLVLWHDRWTDFEAPVTAEDWRLWRSGVCCGTGGEELAE